MPKRKRGNSTVAPVAPIAVGDKIPDSSLVGTLRNTVHRLRDMERLLHAQPGAKRADQLFAALNNVMEAMQKVSEESDSIGDMVVPDEVLNALDNPGAGTQVAGGGIGPDAIGNQEGSNPDLFAASQVQAVRDLDVSVSRRVENIRELHTQVEKMRREASQD